MIILGLNCRESAPYFDDKTLSPELLTARRWMIWLRDFARPSALAQSVVRSRIHALALGNFSAAVRYGRASRSGAASECAHHLRPTAGESSARLRNAA